MRPISFSEYLSQASSILFDCQTIEQLVHALDKFTDALGFSVASYQLIHPIGWNKVEGPVVLFAKGFSDRMRANYVNYKLYANDPLFKVATRTGQVFWWKDIEKISDLTRDEKKFMSGFSKSGLGDGFSIPTFGPNGRNGYFGMGQGVDDRNLPQNAGQILQLYCQTLHLRYCELTRGHHAEVNLSAKEKEVMTHVVHGLSTNQIAEVMGVSANTVNTHLKRIYAKLKVQDRVSATLRFLASGQIYE